MPVLEKSMNILLVYPKFPDTFWSFKHALRFIGKKAVSPPLGLLTVAAMLPADYNVRLVDLNISALRSTDLAWADYVFLSAMIVQQESVHRVIVQCKAAGVPIVAGGPLFSSNWEAFPEIDHLVLNEAELTLPDFLADLRAGCPKHIYASTDYADIQTSPSPRWELANLRSYATMPLQYSRGCPFDCEFCDVTALLGHRPRLKSVSQVLLELNTLKNLGWKDSVFFVDDNFIGNKRYLKTELLPALIDWQRQHGPIAFNSQASINLADDPVLIDMMARAGFDTVFIGIETPDPAALLECNKRQNVNRDLLLDIRRIQAAGIQVQGGFIIGFDHDDASIFQRQIEFIQSSGIVTAMVGLLQATPGTRLYHRLKKQNRLRDNSSGNNVTASTNVVPLMDPEVLRKGYARVLRALYSPRGYYRRLRTFLHNYQAPVVRSRFRWQYLLAFPRSLIVLGVFGRERVQYWRLLFWTTLHRPRLLTTAVYLSIVGNHYRRVCRKVWQA
jgi:radical SAM superfamily enzyme YgiQ (UPF0313 family)